jgi:hypothetical protein
MATPVFITGFEHQVLSAQGGGLFNNVVGSEITIDTTVFNTGSASLKINTTGSTASNVRKTLAAGTQILVLSGYIRLGSNPNLNSIFFGTQAATGSYFSGIEISTAGVIRCRTGSAATTIVSSVTMTHGQQYLIDLRINQSGTTWTVDWAIDGVAQTQVSATGQTAGDIASIRLGTNTASVVILGWIDDIFASATSGDYPIGPHGTEFLSPASDGTHNAGTNTMENQAGTDIGTAWSLLDDVPMSVATEYLRQATIGTGNYAEVVFETMLSALSSVLGAMAVLAYTAATTSTDSGGAIVSKDSFSTQTVLHGVSGSLADYSDGSTSDVYYKSAIITDLDTLSEANSIKARMGYSDDVTPNPYWVNIGVEVAYVPASTVALDLVSYSMPVKDITITEHELILTDLVSYSLPVKDIVVTEHEIVSLNSTSYSSVINDLSLIIHEVINLDLVLFPSSINDVVIVEHENLGLDLVSYSSELNDIEILVHETIDLELVLYTSSLAEVIVLEHEIDSLELVSFSSQINDINILAADIVGLDLVSYSSSILDIELTNDENVDLDLVTYGSSLQDLSLITHETIGLDLVSYVSSLSDINIGVSESIPLDLVSYDYSANDVSLTEQETIELSLVSYAILPKDITIIVNEKIELDLVSYSVVIQGIVVEDSELTLLDSVAFSSTFLSMLVIAPEIVVTTPLNRCYLVYKEDRSYAIESEERTISIRQEERTFLVQ